MRFSHLALSLGSRSWHLPFSGPHQRHLRSLRGRCSLRPCGLCTLAWRIQVTSKRYHWRCDIRWLGLVLYSYTWYIYIYNIHISLSLSICMYLYVYIYIYIYYDIICIHVHTHTHLLCFFFFLKFLFLFVMIPTDTTQQWIWGRLLRPRISDCSHGALAIAGWFISWKFLWKNGWSMDDNWGVPLWLRKPLKALDHFVGKLQVLTAANDTESAGVWIDPNRELVRELVREMVA